MPMKLANASAVDILRAVGTTQASRPTVKIYVVPKRSAEPNRREVPATGSGKEPRQLPRSSGRRFKIQGR